jgi:hypothetical protein
LGKASCIARIAITPSPAMPANATRQPRFWPTQVASGTPPMLAIVSPMNIPATALACLAGATRLSATTEPTPKKAPWQSEVTTPAYRMTPQRAD